jgi:predicted ATP-grasp superfamily ATP-dependent carboligase
VRGNYNAIFLGSEEILEIVLPYLNDQFPSGLLLPEPWAIKILLSKYSTLRLAQEAGVDVPRTLIPFDESELPAMARELGLPIVVKGERGEGRKNVRVATKVAGLLDAYREIRSRERSYCGRPFLQEFIAGAAFSVGGLFHRGRALRICAHRKLLTYPPSGGLTVKGRTERHTGLLESAFRIFKALEYTGLAHVEFIQDRRDGKFRLIEINPRVWGSIGIARHAGVDFYKPYQDLVNGLPVEPDLRYREGIEYHRLSAGIRLVFKRPLHLCALIPDLLTRRVFSDFELYDSGPKLFATFGLRWPG